jgi:nitroreductase
MEDGKSNYTGECLHCGHCVAICPVGAVSIPEYEMDDVEEWDKTRTGLEMDTLLSAIKFRRSIRFYENKAVEQEKLEKIIQAGRYTATGANTQGCKFIIVQDQLAKLKEIIWRDLIKAVDAGKEEMEQMKNLVELYQDKKIDYLFRDAKAVLYIATDNLWDAGLAAQNMELAMNAQGLGALYNGFLVWSTKISEEAKQFLKVCEKPIAVAMLFGYSQVEYVRTAPRRSADVVWL